PRAYSAQACPLPLVGANEGAAHLLEPPATGRALQDEHVVARFERGGWNADRNVCVGSGSCRTRRALGMGGCHTLARAPAFLLFPDPHESETCLVEFCSLPQDPLQPLELAWPPSPADHVLDVEAATVGARRGRVGRSH